MIQLLDARLYPPAERTCALAGILHLCCFGPDYRNQEWPRMDIIIIEIKVLTDQTWGSNHAKHYVDTPGARFGHEADEHNIKQK